MMKVSRTFAAIPPGYTIKEQLDDRNMTQKEFASRMNMSEEQIGQLLNGDNRLTPYIAMRLESVLGIPASFWNNLEAIYREKLLRVESENAMEADDDDFWEMVGEPVSDIELKAALEGI